MSEQFYTILTKEGKAKIANSNILGQKLNLSKFQVGDGGGSYYTLSENQTQLKNKVWEGNISSISIDKDNPSWIVLETIIPSDVGGFTIREASIVDDAGNLIAVGKYPETYKPLLTDGAIKDLVLRMILEINSTQNITLKVDPTVILANKKDIEVLEIKLKSVENAVLELKNNPIVKGVIPSGFIKFNDIDFVYCSINQNKIKLNNEGIALVNGWKVTIPDGTIIELGNPPTEGEREDLIFLECWLDQTTKELKSRIRVVDGIDFNKFYEGLSSIVDWNGYLYKATAQGGLDTPITPSLNTGGRGMFRSNFHRKAWNYLSNIDDNGLYVYREDSNTIKTFDGMVYAIPMFRIWRRNSSPFSDVNPNGGALKSLRDYNVVREYQSTISSSWILELDSISDISIGDLFTRTDLLGMIDTLGYNYLSKVESIQNNIVTFRNVRSISAWNMSSVVDGFNKITKLSTSARPDFLLSDIVDQSDVIDLRHQVLMHDYEQMLAENFEKALRGELQTNIYNDMMKTYHGIRKTSIDANTIFYYSGDGTKDPELGPKFKDIESNLKFNFYNSTTGLGVSNASKLAISTFNNFIENEGTLDFWIDYGGLSKHSYGYTSIVSLYENETKRFLTVYHKYNVDGSLSTLYFEYFFAKADGSETYDALAIDTNVIRGGFHHIRINWKGPKITTYVDGKLSGTWDFSTSNRVRSKCNTIILSNSNKSTLSDLSISNIDRGSTFATLPQDFIKGYAKIMPAFNEQRWCYSDALTTEFKQEVIKSASPNTYPRYLKVTQASGNWVPNDTIKIKGLGGEIIGGVIDTDTALARVVQNNTSTSPATIYVDDVSKFVINDTLSITVLANNSSWTGYTVSAIDTVNKTITITWVSGGSTTVSVGDFIFETTASSSTPNVYVSGLSKVNGTWSGLGTNEATFTLGTTASLTNQDIVVEYSLVEAPGQGAFTDVLYQTLGGEVNGKKLVKSEGPHVVDDFKGKVRGSVVENPNIAKFSGSLNLLLPNAFTDEFGLNAGEASSYNAISKLDNSLGTVGGVLGNGRASILMSFNIVEIIERKYGKIPLMDKVRWCKENIGMAINWYGYGRGKKGDRIYLSLFRNKSNIWSSDTFFASDTNNTIKKLSIGCSPNFSWFDELIDNNGFIHVIAYSDESDGVIPSFVFTDYINIEIYFKKPSEEYDIIYPTNPRRDDGLGTIAYIRKETNELRFPFKAPTNAITFGNYVPYQGTQILPQNGTYPLTDWKVIATSIGTGGYDSLGNAWARLYKGLYNLPMYTKDDMSRFSGLPMKILGDETSITRVGYVNTNVKSISMPIVLYNSVVSSALSTKYYRGWKLDNFLGEGDTTGGAYGIRPDVDISGQYYLIAARLLKDSQGNIIMLIARSLSDTLLNYGGDNAADTFYLDGRPMEV